MNEIGILLSVQRLAFNNWVQRIRWMDILKIAALVFLGVFFLGFIFGGFWKLFHYFLKVPLLGPTLVFRFLSMVFFGFFAMLLFSNIITSLSTIYLSKDLLLLWSYPIQHLSLFLSRFYRTFVASSWMILLMSVPILMALGTVYHADMGFYLGSLFFVFLFLVFSAGVGVMFTMVLMRFFPAQKMRDLFLLLGIIFVCALAIFFRFLEPEKMINPSEAMEYMEFLDQMQVPTAPYLPSAWLTEAVTGLLNEDLGRTLRNGLYLLSSSLLSLGLCWTMAYYFFYGGWCHAQESLGVQRGKARFLRGWPEFKPMDTAFGALLTKDLKILLRDTTQWSQLLLLSSLVVIYVYNLYKLPMNIMADLVNALFFITIGAGAFIVAAIGARFVFPAISLEGKSFWIIKNGPVLNRTILREKYFFGAATLVFLSLILMGFSIYIFKVDRYMAVLSLSTTVLLTLGITSLAAGLGAYFARFEVANPEEIVTSWGGLVYMMFAVLYIAVVLAILAFPVYRHYFRKMVVGLHYDPLLELWIPLLAVLLVHSLTLWLPYQIGLRALKNREI